MFPAGPALLHGYVFRCGRFAEEERLDFGLGSAAARFLGGTFRWPHLIERRRRGVGLLGAFRDWLAVQISLMK
jgi:hypothetical protein